MERLRPIRREESPAETSDSGEGTGLNAIRKLSYEEMLSVGFDQGKIEEMAKRKIAEERRRAEASGAAETASSDSEADASTDETPAESVTEPTPEGVAPRIEVEPTEIESPITLGGVELSFSDMKPSILEERWEGETDEHFKERCRRRDQNLFIRGFLRAEAGDENAMQTALSGVNYRFKRQQRREFLSALANLSGDEYAEKVFAALPESMDKETREYTLWIANSVYTDALMQKQKDLINGLEDEFNRDFSESDELLRVPDSRDFAEAVADASSDEEHESEAHARRRRFRVVEGDAGEPSEFDLAVRRAEAEGVAEGEHVPGTRREAEGSVGEERASDMRRETDTSRTERAPEPPARRYRSEKHERRSKGFFSNLKKYFGSYKNDAPRPRVAEPSRRPDEARIRPDTPRPRTEEARVRNGRPAEHDEGRYFEEPVATGGAVRPEGGYFGNRAVATGGAPRPEGGYFESNRRRRAKDLLPRTDGDSSWRFLGYDDLDGADYAV